MSKKFSSQKIKKKFFAMFKKNWFTNVNWFSNVYRKFFIPLLLLLDAAAARDKMKAEGIKELLEKIYIAARI